MRQNIWMLSGIIVSAFMVVIVILSIALGGCTTMIECTTGSVPMKCHWTFISTRTIGIAGFLIALVSTFARTKEGRRIGAFATAIMFLLIVAILSPLGIGVCASLDMHCQTTAWTVAGTSVIGLIVTIVQMIKADPENSTRPKKSL